MPRQASSRSGRGASSARDAFLAQVRLWHFMNLVSAIHFDLPETAFDGDAREGRFFSMNGQGDHHFVLWNESGVVAMAFDHESPESEYHLDPAERSPERLFAGVPAELAPLVGRLLDSSVTQRLGTAARWVATTSEGEVTGEYGESDAIGAYVKKPADVLDGWRELSSISKAQAKIAAKLAKAGGSARQTIDDKDGFALLAAPPAQKGTVPNPANVERAALAFAKAGVDWPSGVETAKRLASDDPDGGFALIDACAAGDLGAVGALLAKGANVERRARAGQLRGVWQRGGETPLTLALYAGHLDIARALLDAGAKPNAKGQLHYPLGVAADRGSLEGWDLLMARGADPKPLLGSIFYGAVQGGNPDIVERAFDLGAEANMSLYWYRMFLAIVEKSGRTDLVARVPNLERLQGATAAQEARAWQEAKDGPSNIAWHCRLLHLVHAVRAIHFEPRVSCHFAGTATRGRFAIANDERERAVLAWSEAGAVGWGVGSPSGAVPPERGPPEKVFEAASPALRALADDLANWEHAPPTAEQARWIDPHASSFATTQGSFGNAATSEIWCRGEHSHTPRDEKLPWPKAALTLDARTARAISRIAAASHAGQYDHVTPDDEALLLAPQPRGSARPSAEGLAEAARRFAEVGIRWEPAGGGTARP